MLLEIDEEEWEFILRVCVRAKSFARMDLLKGISCIDPLKDMEKIDALIDKLEKAKNDNRHRK